MAGYPEAHPDKIVSDPEEMKKNYWDDIHYLKEKVGSSQPEDEFAARKAAYLH